MVTQPCGTPIGRVAIVTGGSRGTGRDVAERLATRGFAVVVDYAHDQRAAESTVDGVLARDGEAVAVRADVTDTLDVERLFAETVAMFDGIDVVVHAAASQVTAALLADVDLEELDAVCRMNTWAMLIVNREAARQLRNGGAIVNVASSVAGSALPNHGVYVATKAAVDVLTRTLAVEVRERDITVSAVSLDVDTPCEPSRVADLVTYLLSASGRALTGRVIRLHDPWR
jgi:3-oxoacyl-[acyl-carrier protein] reductase